jgi:hypothetical protein
VLKTSERAGDSSGDTDAYGAIADCYTELGDLERAGKVGRQSSTFLRSFPNMYSSACTLLTCNWFSIFRSGANGRGGDSPPGGLWGGYGWGLRLPHFVQKKSGLIVVFHGARSTCVVDVLYAI